MNLEDVQGLLPDSVQVIAGLIGFEATEKLIERLGGRSFPIGKAMSSRGERRLNLLQQVIGESNTTLICRHFGGATLYIPRCDKAFSEWRNKRFVDEIERLKLQGVSTLEAIETCCSDFGLTDRKAWRVLKRYRDGDSGLQQGSLF
ncbi:Mor transcription activator family protein [Enterobacter ludwigii]|uniref:Mor transcription activator family protein n=1 Tax=Enterobacter TaxID=547 RepID=UPI003BEF489C